MDPEGLLPCSQKPVTVRILRQLNPIHSFPPNFPKIHSNILLSSTSTLPSGIFPSGFRPEFCMYFSSPHLCYMTGPSQSPWFDHPNNIWRSAKVTKLLIMQSSPAFCHFVPPAFENSPQHPVPKYSRYVQIKEDAMDRRCSTHGEIRNACKILDRKSEGNRPPGSSRRRGIIIWKWVLQK